MNRPLGRIPPKDFVHVQKYRFTAPPPITVERILPLPYWHWEHDQGSEGACVGFGLSMMMAIRNEQQARNENKKPFTHRYDALWLYHEAQKVDEWAGEDYSGTSVRAGCDILRDVGHRRVINRISKAPNPAEGISANRWATTVDDMRAAINQDNPITIGINWYTSFDKPTKPFPNNADYWIATVGIGNWGQVRGGHCVTLYGASDRNQAFALKNSWGKSYPLVYLPYFAMEQLLRENGEAALISDR